MFSESGIDEGDDTVKDVILECCTDDFVLCKNLVIIPLYSLSGSWCMVYNIGSVQMVESSRFHILQIILDPWQIHEVNPAMYNIVILPHFVEYPL